MMDIIYMGIVVFLFLNLLVGVWRIFYGPTDADRILASQLFGTMTIMILLLLAQISVNNALRDVALLFASLAAVTAVAFVQSSTKKKDIEHDTD